MRARARSLPPAEIAVGGGGAALAGRDDVAVHADAHRAAAFAPREPRLREDLVEAFLLGLMLYLRRPGRHQPGHFRLAAREHRGRRAKILDARIWATSEEHTHDANFPGTLSRQE